MKIAAWSTVMVKFWVAGVWPFTVAVMVPEYEDRSFTFGVPPMVAVPLPLLSRVRPLGSPVAANFGVPVVVQVVTSKL